MAVTSSSAAAPTDVPVTKVPLSREQRAWIEAVHANVSIERMTQFCLGITSIHSPTGFERAVNEWLADQLRQLGMDARYQRIDDNTGNAYGYHGAGTDGPTMLLYAPTDTHLDLAEEEDIPWVGPAFRPDMLPKPYVDAHGNVIGLGANNPKGMVTAIWGALDAITRANVPLRGRVLAAFAGGGMPVEAPPKSRTADAGLGSGVSYMINHGVTADFGIISKPGYAVAWEEVGLCWFRVYVRGGYIGYAGRPHDVPEYKNMIVETSKIVLELEEWIGEYSKRNTSGLVTPWGQISNVHGGWMHKPAFPPANVVLQLDIRVNPRSTPSDVRAQFAEAMGRIQQRHADVRLDWEMFAAYPAASTDPHHWVVQSTMRGWEHVEQKTHHARAGTSGQTDASAIRNLGIPLARIGHPSPAPGTPPEWLHGLGGMGVGHIPDFARVAKVLIYAVVDSCTRSREEVGLA
ncbi:MAG: acetylornithine deacetylase [SAR202 cluster bacterium]|nr:acetylornithine deacetylase [SAR202 cluster bacterium]